MTPFFPSNSQGRQTRSVVRAPPRGIIDNQDAHLAPLVARPAKMLLLDYQNVLIQSVLTERFSGQVCPPPCRTAHGAWR